VTNSTKASVNVEPRARIDQALDVLRDMPSAGELYELGRRTRVVVSRTWAGAGGSALLRRVNLPPSALEWSTERLASLLAHELVHVRQGITLFGSLDTEREAFIVQCKVELELMSRGRPAPHNEIKRREADLRTLERSPESAKKWILAKGPYYDKFPDTRPHWWQVRLWWPQVRYALTTAWSNRRAGGQG
jgi:hypothetical protein